MDVVIQELDGNLARFLLSIPLDLIVLLSVLYVSASLAFYLFKHKSRTSIALTVVLGAVFFGGYYLYARPTLLDSPGTSLVFASVLAGFAYLAPAMLANERSKAFKLLKVILVIGIRRVLEFTIALTVLVALAPVILVISVLIKLTTGGTILVRQPSSSHSGKSIMMYSFRTRIPYRYKYVNDVFFMISERDWRFTRFGRFLHKSSLHLIPRLFNVLTGDLHLIGLTPLHTRLLLSGFAQQLLRIERELVEKLCEGDGAKAFPTLIDYYIPTGVITYSDLYAYKFEAASRTVFKFLDIRPRLQEEASYFTSQPLPSLRLFILLLVKFGIRLLMALNLLKLKEVHDVWRGSINKEAVR